MVGEKDRELLRADLDQKATIADGMTSTLAGKTCELEAAHSSLADGTLRPNTRTPLTFMKKIARKSVNELEERVATLMAELNEAKDQCASNSLQKGRLTEATIT